MPRTRLDNVGNSPLLTEDLGMSLATLSLDQILKTPLPSYHKPLELARRPAREPKTTGTRPSHCSID